MATRTSSKPRGKQPGMTRGQKLWSMVRDRRDTADYSLGRAKLLTASWKETEGLPIPIRRAKAFEKIVTEIPIFIDEDQLLVGDWGTNTDAEYVELRPELTVDDIERGFKEGWLERRFSPEDQKALREIYEYWKNKALMQSFLNYLDFMGEEKVKQLTELSERNDYVFVVFAEFGDRSWYSPDWEKAIKKGLSGILAEVEEELQTTHALDDASRDKKYFLQGLAIVIRAGIKYGKRYAALAREMAKNAKGKRKAELGKIAEICDWVPENPARTFHEALQTMWLCDCCLYWDTGSHMRAAPGRVDQYFFPYYQRDIDEGRLTDEEVIELLECLRVKCSGQRLTASKYEDSIDRVWTGDPMFINCTLGGQTPDGKDAVNRLSYLWLEAAMRVRSPHPTLSVRYHTNLSPDFAMKAAELNRLGLGYPAWFGDKGNIEYILGITGATLSEARDYRPVGCLLPDPPHTVPGKWPAIMNMAKVLEITFNNGVDPRSGRQHGLAIGKLEDFKTFEELYDAYKKQLTYFMELDAEELNQVRLFRVSKLPQMFASCLFDDCIKRGQDVVGGGPRYQQGAMYLIPVGIMDVVDSLAAMKKFVYEEGTLSKTELMEALRVNFEGKEDIRRILLSAPKYGNDDDYVDSIAVDLYNWVCDMVDGIDACYGATYVCAPHTISFHGPAGLKVGALPSGRLSGVSVAEGAVSPCQGMDTNGPTAVIRSAGKVAHSRIFGTLFNMKFSPTALKTREDLTKFLALINTYLVDYGGEHIQFNVMDRKTLIDAQKHPERYRNLVVRVAGYSALWVELSPEIQNEIIARTEHEI